MQETGATSSHGKPQGLAIQHRKRRVIHQKRDTKEELPHANRQELQRRLPWKHAITKNLKQIMGAKNIVKTFFPQGDPTKDLHVGVCNLEVLNPIVYKQYVRKNIKLLHMYAWCTPHPHILDGTNCLSEQILKEFGFTNVNIAIVNAMTAISNQPIASSL
jgi:hypothetical protein